MLWCLSKKWSNINGSIDADHVFDRQNGSKTCAFCNVDVSSRCSENICVFCYKLLILIVFLLLVPSNRCLVVCCIVVPSIHVRPIAKIGALAAVKVFAIGLVKSTSPPPHASFSFRWVHQFQLINVVIRIRVRRVYQPRRRWPKNDPDCPHRRKESTKRLLQFSRHWPLDFRNIRSNLRSFQYHSSEGARIELCRRNNFPYFRTRILANDSMFPND